MPNISGEYTLGEVSAQLGASPAWIGKVRTLTGIGGTLGTQGKKSNFTEKDLKEIKNARLLRNLNFDYKDIKNIYDIEIELLKERPAKGDKDDYPLMIHDAKIYMPEKNMDITDKWLRRFIKICWQVENRATKLIEELTEFRLQKQLTKKAE